MELTKQLNETEEQIEVMTLRWTEDSDRLEELE
jgi:hypothetical protein